MRVAIIAFGAAIAAVVLVPPAQAVNAPKDAAAGIDHIQPVAEGCGYGYHWVERYRNSNGYWVPGHCVRNS
jgi:hypothetical protein